MCGATGLDYAAVYAAFQIQGIKKKRQKRLLADIMVLEAAALKEMRSD